LLLQKAPIFIYYKKNGSVNKFTISHRFRLIYIYIYRYEIIKKKNLWILDLIDDAGRGEVEDSGAAIDGGYDGVVVKEIDLEETEADLCAF
jgi:hypothetical protein